MLLPLLSFSGEELGFIINYDIKHRMNFGTGGARGQNFIMNAIDNVSCELRKIEKEIDSYYKSNPLAQIPICDCRMVFAGVC